MCSYTPLGQRQTESDSGAAPIILTQKLVSNCTYNYSVTEENTELDNVYNVAVVNFKDDTNSLFGQHSIEKANFLQPLTIYSPVNNVNLNITVHTA